MAFYVKMSVSMLLSNKVIFISLSLVYKRYLKCDEKKNDHVSTWAKPNSDITSISFYEK